jgi:hypothetical protein
MAHFLAHPDRVKLDVMAATFQSKVLFLPVTKVWQVKGNDCAVTINQRYPALKHEK